MSRRRALRRVYLFVPLTGLVLISGCLAALERNVDLILAPQALGNTLVAPYSPVSGLIEAFVRLIRG